MKIHEIRYYDNKQLLQQIRILELKFRKRQPFQELCGTGSLQNHHDLNEIG